MFLTNILLKKAKGKHVVVAVKSIATGHMRNVIRERSADKVEAAYFDPFAGGMALYREVRRVRSLR